MRILRSPIVQIANVSTFFGVFFYVNYIFYIFVTSVELKLEITNFSLKAMSPNLPCKRQIAIPIEFTFVPIYDNYWNIYRLFQVYLQWSFSFAFHVIASATESWIYCLSCSNLISKYSFLFFNDEISTATRLWSFFFVYIPHINLGCNVDIKWYRFPARQIFETIWFHARHSTKLYPVINFKWNLWWI